MSRHVRSLLLCTLATAGLAAGAAGQQGTIAPPGPTLPSSLQDHVRNERLQVVTSLRGLPLGVREALQTLFGTRDLDIAEPGAAYLGASGGSTSGPRRRLAVAGCSYDHCLVHYERAGSNPAWLVALFHWTPGATRLEGGGVSRREFKTLEEVRAAIVADQFLDPTGRW